MELKELRIKNFLGIGYAEVNFDKRGLTLIEGKNNDSPSSISNGAGKSSIFEAPFLGAIRQDKAGADRQRCHQPDRKKELCR